MNCVKILPLIFFLLLCFYVNGQIPEFKEKNVFVECDLLTDQPVDSALFRLTLYKIGVPLLEEQSEYGGKISNKRVKWEFQAREPVFMYCKYLNAYFWILPGDSLHVGYKNGAYVYSGNCSERIELQVELDNIRKSNIKPTRSYVIINSLEDYFNWKKYLDSQLDQYIEVIDGYKGTVSTFFLDLIKARMVYDVEFKRAETFVALFYSKQDKINLGLTADDLIKICDTTLNGYWAKWLRTSTSDYLYSFIHRWYFYQYNRIQIWKRFNFDLNHASLNSNEKRRLQYFKAIKENYTGLLRERVLQYLVADEVIKELGFSNPVTEEILSDYYSHSAFPEYKKWVKQYENKLRQLQTGKRAPYFSLQDVNGNTFSKKDLAGKIALIDFWFTGCTGCVQMAPALQKIEDEFKDDSNVVFVSISVDSERSKWLNSLKQKKYTTGNAVNLYTNGEGNNHPVVKMYNISEYPELVLIGADPGGRILKYPLPDPRDVNKRKELISLIKKESYKKTLSTHAINSDGPYVLYKKDSIYITYVRPVGGKAEIKTERINQNGKNYALLQVATDKPGMSFNVKLKKELLNEPCIFRNVDKQIVISDIEGNFDAFRKLLQANKVIDNEYNWIFGKGHLVLLGDFFDRGLQVTEVLWLIYSLEEKAKSAGGYVHFILGNHEIMNLNGDVRYVKDKYKNISKQFPNEYASLYGTNSELGKWLRTKNIIEKINDVLYVHGGVSPQINELQLTIEEINNVARPYYAGSIDSSNKQLIAIFNKSNAVFWYRDYYKEGAGSDKTSISCIDSSLTKFQVSRIITGHTVIKEGEKVTTHYYGRVINLDTKHAEAKSEALLIEYDKYFRINTDGVKVLLFPPIEKAISRN